jgi:hypothetical protein
MLYVRSVLVGMLVGTATLFVSTVLFIAILIFIVWRKTPGFLGGSGRRFAYEVSHLVDPRASRIWNRFLLAISQSVALNDLFMHKFASH